MRTYWLCQFLVFISIVLINYGLGVALLNTSIEHHANLLLRTISHASVFVLLTHFILYTLGNKLCGKLKIARLNIFLLSALSILLALMQTLNVIYFTPFILPEGASSMSIQMYGETTVDLNEKQFTGIISSFLNALVMSLIWSGCYLAVVSRREKKLIMSQLKEQQLESLKNQINPHFLFNTLNTIRGMIYQDQDKAADIVTQLSELFRYNLTTDLQTHVNFDQEWKVCEHYLAIEKVRFGKRLLVTMQCDDSLKKVVLPSMALLTLIENATKHGIAHLEEGGEIKVNVVRTGETVTITVSNPFDETKLKSGTKLGLQNIQSRLELMFAQRGKLLIQKQSGQFNATLEVPYAA